MRPVCLSDLLHESRCRPSPASRATRQSSGEARLGIRPRGWRRAGPRFREAQARSRRACGEASRHLAARWREPGATSGSPVAQRGQAAGSQAGTSSARRDAARDPVRSAPRPAAIAPVDDRRTRPGPRRRSGQGRGPRASISPSSRRPRSRRPARPASSAKPRRNAKSPSTRSAKIARPPRPRPTSWPMISPPSRARRRRRAKRRVEPPPGPPPRAPGPLGPLEDLRALEIRVRVEAGRELEVAGEERAGLLEVALDVVRGHGVPSSRRGSSRFALQAVPVDLLVEVRARRVDRLRRPRDVSGVLGELGDEEELLGLVLERLERRDGDEIRSRRRRRRRRPRPVPLAHDLAPPDDDRRAEARRRPRADGSRVDARVDDVAVGHDHQPLDVVLQLADVSRPGRAASASSAASVKRFGL